MEIVELFRSYADICAAAQQKAIELESHPDKKKHVRAFAAREAAQILGVSQSHLRNLCRNPDFPQGEIAGNGRRSFTIENLHEARTWLAKSTGNARYEPGRREGDQLQVVTFVNFKGGSGKTTSATHFAQYLALHGYRVLLIDLDPQASATAMFGIAPDTEIDAEATFAAWLRRDDEDDVTNIAKSIVRETYWPGLNLVPAGIALQHAEYELVGKLIGQRDFPFYRELSDFVDQVESDYDVVVCDCRPDVGMMTINALIAATGMIVPMPASMIDFASSGEFFRFMSEVASDLHRSVSRDLMAYDFVKILTTKFKANDKNQQEILTWKNAFFQSALLPEPMLETAALDAAGIVKESLYEYDPTGNRRSYDRALDSMNAVNHAIEAELLACWGRKAQPQLDLV